MNNNTTTHSHYSVLDDYQPTPYDLAHQNDGVSEDGHTCECGLDVTECAATPNPWVEAI